MSELKRYFEQDRFAAGAGIELVEVREGFARARLTVEDRHLNSAGVIQGGAVFTLADFAFAVACNTHGTLALAVSTHIEFLRGARTGAVLTAEAREESCTRKISTCGIRVTDGDGNLVALFTGTAYRKGDPIPSL
jgi:acyl-CoA thioesterase